MDVEQEPLTVSQLSLFDFDDFTTGLVELFPTVWAAAENLTAQEPRQRLQALEILDKCGAIRLSPLIAYLVFTRLTDPDLEVRKRVVQALSDVLSIDQTGKRAPDAVRQQLVSQLMRMRTREIYALLQLLSSAAQMLPVVSRLLLGNPYAGNHLAELATQRKMPLEIRRQAIRLIGEVGYLDAIPTLERMQMRLEARASGQQAMPFAPPGGVDDLELLTDVKYVLLRLRSL